MVNQDPPIHPQSSTTPRESNTQRLTILDPEEKGKEQGTHTSKLISNLIKQLNHYKKKKNSCSRVGVETQN